MQEQAAEHDSTEQNSEKWVSLIWQYSDLQELNSCIINELITKILVGDKHRVNGEKVQSIEIHYRFIGNLTDSGNGEKSQFCCENYAYLLNAPFNISDRCCHITKKDLFAQ